MRSLRGSAAVPAATAVSVALGEHVRVVTATDRVACVARPFASVLVQAVERVVDLAAGAQGGDTAHVEERARVVVCEGSVEVSHGLTVTVPMEGSRIFSCATPSGSGWLTQAYSVHFIDDAHCFGKTLCPALLEAPGVLDRVCWGTYDINLVGCDAASRVRALIPRRIPALTPMP